MTSGSPTIQTEPQAAAQDILGGLREVGVRIVLDNFGTGYSSLYHLRSFKMDKVKIDRSFIRAMLSERTVSQLSEGYSDKSRE